MPHNVRQLSFVACFLLVVLRVSIGWQFLYEGLWKLGTLKTSQHWTAEGYLKNAVGPFRPQFRSLVTDPDSLDKLDYDKVAKSWDEWYQRFQARYPDLDEGQKRTIEALLNGQEAWAEPLAALPPEVDLAKFKTPKGTYLKYEAKQKRLITNLHLLPSEREALLKLAPDDENADAATKTALANYRKAVLKLFERTSKLSLKERLQVLLKDDADRVGMVQEAHAGTIDHIRPGEIQIYKHLLERYERNLLAAKQDFHQEHLANQWLDIQTKRVALVGPVDALTKDLQTTAYKVLTPAQLANGPVEPPPTRLAQINKMTMWALVIFGGAMIVGLFSRLSALGAAGLLLMFYLAMPPWPGVPEAPGPEHSMIINKNLIECLACLALATIPTGRWIGLDAFIRRFIFRRVTE